MLLEQQLAETIDPAQGCAQVMRDRIGEGLELPVGGRQFGGACGHLALELRVQARQFFFLGYQFGDVGAAIKQVRHPAIAIADRHHQGVAFLKGGGRFDAGTVTHDLAGRRHALERRQPAVQFRRRQAGDLAQKIRERPADPVRDADRDELCLVEIAQGRVELFDDQLLAVNPVYRHQVGGVLHGGTEALLQAVHLRAGLFKCRHVHRHAVAADDAAGCVAMRHHGDVQNPGAGAGGILDPAVAGRGTLQRGIEMRLAHGIGRLIDDVAQVATDQIGRRAPEYLLEGTVDIEQAQLGIEVPDRYRHAFHQQAQLGLALAQRMFGLDLLGHPVADTVVADEAAFGIMQGPAAVARPAHFAGGIAAPPQEIAKLLATIETRAVRRPVGFAHVDVAHFPRGLAHIGHAGQQVLLQYRAFAHGQAMIFVAHPVPVGRELEQGAQAALAFVQRVVRNFLGGDVTADSTVAGKTASGREDRLAADRKPAQLAVFVDVPVLEITKYLVPRQHLAVCPPLILAYAEYSEFPAALADGGAGIEAGSRMHLTPQCGETELGVLLPEPVGRK